MSESWLEHEQRKEQETLEALGSDHPWRVQSDITGWNVVAVIGDEVVEIARCATRGMAVFICGLRNSGR